DEQLRDSLVRAVAEARIRFAVVVDSRRQRRPEDGDRAGLDEANDRAAAARLRAAAIEQADRRVEVDPPAGVEVGLGRAADDRREVEDAIDRLREQAVEVRRVGDVAVVAVGRDHVVADAQRVDEGTADEAVGAGDEDAHRYSPGARRVAPGVISVWARRSIQRASSLTLASAAASAAAARQSSWLKAESGAGASTLRASWVAMPMSLSINASLNGSSKLRLSTRWRMCVREIHEPPVDWSRTSTIAAGSSP